MTLLRPVSAVYGRIIASRNAAYDHGRRSIARLPVPVVSVGNLSVGGTGKTPAVRWIVEALAAAGVSPVISLRGYRAGSGGRSDEAILHEEAGGAAVVAARDRFEAVSRWLTKQGTQPGQCVVLDDGFQHRQLHRDFDLVVIDATRSPWNDALLPTGRLREPPTSLARSDGVLLTHGEAVTPEALRELRRRVSEIVRPETPIAVSRHVWRGVRVGSMVEPATWLRGRRVLAVCAIGNPQAFLQQARESRAEIVDAIVLRDHAPYDKRSVARIISTAQRASVETVLTTEKDWVKLRTSSHLMQSGLAIARADLALEPMEGAAELRSAILAVAGVKGTDR